MNKKNSNFKTIFGTAQGKDIRKLHTKIQIDNSYTIFTNSGELSVKHKTL